MAARHIGIMVAGVALAAAACRRGEQVRADEGPSATVSAEPASAAARTSATASSPASPLLVWRVLPGEGPTRWFEPVAASLRLHEIEGVVYVGAEHMYRTEGDQLTWVPLPFADEAQRADVPAWRRSREADVMVLFGHHAPGLWFIRPRATGYRVALNEMFRQRPDGQFERFAQAAAGNRYLPVLWAGERLLDQRSGRWLDLTGQELPGPLPDLGPGCMASPTRGHPTPTRGWEMIDVSCPKKGKPDGYEFVGTRLFDPSLRVRRIEGVEMLIHFDNLLVRAGGDIWFTAARGYEPRLCHLVGSRAQCEKIPSSDSWIGALTERADGLTMVGADGVWNYRRGKFERQPVLRPDGSEAVLEQGLRDTQGRLWGVAQEPGEQRHPPVRLFRQDP